MSGPIIESYGGARPEIHPTAFVHRSAVLIGRVQIGPEASIWPNTTLRGDDGDIVIGARSNVQDGTTVHITGDLSHTTVGERVTIGHNCIIHGCTIEDDVLVGMGSIVMDNAVLGSWTLLGAGTLVTANKQIPGGSLAFGNPMRVVRAVNAQEREWIAHGWKTYVENSRRYLQEISTTMAR